MSDTLKPNIQDLQKDVIDLLGQISALMGRASTALSSDSSGEKYGQFQQEVIEAARSVKDLELSMAIIAPMKAGKSTIINAIVGQEILPSCAAAMTTLPTEIVFNSEITEPTLTLSAEILSVFQGTILALQRKIQALGTEETHQRTALYPHLRDLLQEIQDTVGFTTRAKTYGREEINKTLTDLNHIIRLCSILEPSKDPLAQLMEVPRIETPFLRSQKTDQTEILGNLVIVDTPGPNEAGENLRLAAVVAEQLRKSSIVLIVLDFTQLNNQAAAEIKKQVQPVIKLLGKENLYVLVNKVDQRGDNDMTPAQVQQFVAADLELSDSGDIDRVFEIAAKWAFSATNFLLELQQHPGINIDQMKSARALAQQVFGIDWEEELEDVPVEDLQRKAERLWKKSGFAPFLDRAINALIVSAAPRCMKTALNLSQIRLVELRNEALIRTTDIAEDTEKLQRQLDALEEDLRHLEFCRGRWKEVDSIKVNLRQELNEILDALRKKAKVSLETYFVKEEYGRASSLKKAEITVRGFIFKDISDFDIFPKWLSQRFKSQLEFKSSSIEFKTAEAAEEFANQAVAYAQKRLEHFLIAAREEATKQVEVSIKNLLIFLRQQTQELIERARTRLNKAFYIDLSPAPLNWETEHVDFGTSKNFKYKREIRNKKEDKKVKERPWYFLWLIEIEKTVKVTSEEGYYAVSIEEIVESVNQAIDKSIENINLAINKYLDEELKQRVDAYFAGLDRYLGSYRDSLRQAQADQQLSLNEKEKLVGQLSSLVPEATAQINRVNTYLKRTEQLISGK
jgi:hypothetical protein